MTFYQYQSRRKLYLLLGFILLCGYTLFHHFPNDTGARIYLSELYRDIVYGPQDQLEVDPETLKQTMQLMLEKRDQYDRKVVDFIRSLLLMPSPNNELNLRNKRRKHFSQSDQSSYIDELLNGKRDGFFIEAGAFDGESYSNSLFFERERNWTGLLIEPIPRYFNQLKEKKRHAYALNACIARDRPIVTEFRVNHALSGRVSEMSSNIREAIEKESLFEKVTHLPCFSVNSVLSAINRTQIDFFSLDVEGGEADVIESIDFNRLSIHIFCIEVFKNERSRARINRKLKANGYKMVRDDGQDLIFVKSS